MNFTQLECNYGITDNLKLLKLMLPKIRSKQPNQTVIWYFFFLFVESMVLSYILSAFQKFKIIPPCSLMIYPS